MKSAPRGCRRCCAAAVVSLSLLWVARPAGIDPHVLSGASQGPVRDPDAPRRRLSLQCRFEASADPWTAQPARPKTRPKLVHFRGGGTFRFRPARDCPRGLSGSITGLLHAPVPGCVRSASHASFVGLGTCFRPRVSGVYLGTGPGSGAQVLTVPSAAASTGLFSAGSPAPGQAFKGGGWRMSVD